MQSSTSPCPICGAATKAPGFPYRTAWAGKDWRYLHCASCGSTFLDPMPTSDELAAMFSKSSYHDRHYADLRTSRYAPSIELLVSKLGANVRLLDFGCGNGAFIACARQRGIDSTGIEWDPETVAFARENSGCPVTTFEQAVAAGRRYDVIHLGDVLAHLPDPVATLRGLEGFLDDGGHLFVEGPLQNNPSLVYWASAGFYRLKTMLGRDVTDDHVPTHLVRMTGSGARAFFTDRLHYAERSFAIHENGWPYLGGGARSGSPASGAVKDWIARAAIAMGGLRGPKGLVFGNYFRAIYRVEPIAR